MLTTAYPLLIDWMMNAVWSILLRAQEYNDAGPTEEDNVPRDNGSGSLRGCCQQAPE